MTPVNSEKAVPTKGAAFSASSVDAFLSHIMSGDMEAYQLPMPLWLVWSAGYEDGRRSRDEEIHDLRVDAQRLWLLALPSSERRTFLLDRLDDAARIALDENHIDDHLERAYQLWVDSLHDLRRPVGSSTTTQDNAGRFAA